MGASQQPKFSIGKLINNGISYVPGQFMVDSFKLNSGRFWLYKNRFSTITFKGVLGEEAREKNFDRFKATEEEVGRFIEEYFKTDPQSPPSNFSDGFHRHFNGYARASGTSQAFLGRRITGGWQSAIKRGQVSTLLRKYDLNSAYAWSASLGLPDPRTFKLSRDVNVRGIYIFKGVVNVDKPPFPMTSGVERIYMMSDEEIRKYNVTVREIYWGQSWKLTLDTRKAIDLVQQKFTDWKRVLRSFWGGWAARRGPSCGIYDKGSITKRWELPNANRNYIWAHLIMSRVKMRMFDVIKNSCYVFVDSVITSDTLPVGNNLGDWKLEKEYPEGIVIFQAGVYRDARYKKLEKHSGRVSDSGFTENESYELGKERISRQEDSDFNDRERQAIEGRDGESGKDTEHAKGRKLPAVWKVRQSGLFEKDSGTRPTVEGY